MRIFLVLAFTLALAACSSPKVEQHSSTGVLREIQQGGKTLVIQHEDFPGFMKAMTMPFDVVDPSITQGLKVGDKVAFTITRNESGYVVTRISRE